MKSTLFVASAIVCFVGAVIAVFSFLDDWEDVAAFFVVWLALPACIGCLMEAFDKGDKRV